MAIIQVARSGNQYAVQEDGVSVPGLTYKTRGQAIAAALQHKKDIQ